MADWLTVKDAAEVLGISQDAVRKRIARGRIEARQQDKTWLVLVDQDTTEQDTAEPAQARSQPRQRQADAARDREIEAMLRARVAELEEQNRQLWEERAQVNTEKERLGQTLQQQAAIIARLVALPAHAGPSSEPEPAEVEPTAEPAAEPPKRRRGFWERIFNP